MGKELIYWCLLLLNTQLDAVNLTMNKTIPTLSALRNR